MLFVVEIQRVNDLEISALAVVLRQLGCKPNSREHHLVDNELMQARFFIITLEMKVPSKHHFLSSNKLQTILHGDVEIFACLLLIRRPRHPSPRGIPPEHVSGTMLF
jgi:hypothetical protein